MEVKTYTELRANLKSVLDHVGDDHEIVVIARPKGPAVVIQSLDSWNAEQATLHLLSTQTNANRLRASIAQLNAGEGTERELIAAPASDSTGP
jgi:antitoxin YefM